MRRFPLRTHKRASRLGYVMGVLILLAGIFPVSVEAIPQVQNRYNQMSDSTAGVAATHRFGFRYTNLSSPVGSVSFEFCSNSPIPQEACIAPSGLDVLAATLSGQTGQTDFTLHSTATAANRLVITRTAQVPSLTNATSTYRFDNVINPSVVGSHYVRIQTFSSTDATGAALEEGGVVFAIIRQFNVSAEVPPFLLLCAAVTITGFDCETATSFFIDFGEFSQTNAKAASSEFLTATNAPFGFSVTVVGTTLTSGNNIIPALSAPVASSPGSSQFGLNLRANADPSIGNNPVGPGTANVTSDYGQANRYKFVSGDTLVSSSTTSDFRKYTMSYVVNINSDQPAGIYATTVSVIALANF